MALEIPVNYMFFAAQLQLCHSQSICTGMDVGQSDPRIGEEVLHDGQPAEHQRQQEAG